MRVIALLRRLPALPGAALIAGLAAALYLPFLSNPPVFDDFFFFSGRQFAYYAMHPFGLELRAPPYFSLAIVQVFWGHVVAHRLVSLALHLGCAITLYKLIFDVQRHAAAAAGAPSTGMEAHAPAFLAAAVFAVHPVAVYGAAYLIQRMTVLATLFSLLSVILFLRGLARRSHADALSAAFLYTIAVLSKETAVLLPAAAAVGGLMVAVERRFLFRHIALYWVACVPAAVLVTLLVKGKIGATEEPNFDVLTAQIAQAGTSAQSPWLESAMTQAGLFFHYLTSWVLPTTGGMSIDVRSEFATAWPPVVAVLAVFGFAAWGALGAWLMRRGPRARAAGFGMLFPWILFLTEFATIRFQEPFVLYRSYLWAPGLALLLALALARMPRRGLVVGAMIVLPLLLYQAHDRLHSFSSGLALWEDAVAKLPERPIPGGSRTLYNLGREYLYRERVDDAVRTVERCLAQYPGTYDCHYARAGIHLYREQYREALPHLARAIALRPREGAARNNLGIALENLGCVEDAKTQYRLAYQIGFAGAYHSLIRLESPGTGLLKPIKRKAPTEVCGRVLPDGTIAAPR